MTRRWMNSALIYAGVTSVLLTLGVLGQTRSGLISLGGMLLSPGMSQEVVIAKLAEDFEVGKMKEDKHGAIWAVSYRREKKSDTPELLGTLIFRAVGSPG